MTSHILLLGKPDSGKTSFISQFYTRIDANKSVFKLYKTVDNLTSIIDAIKTTEEGDEVKTTPTSKSIAISLPLEYNDKKIDLNCPDYGGEQIEHIVESREVSSEWAQSVERSDNWILFIKPTDLETSYDLSNKTFKLEDVNNGSGGSDEYSISDQSFFIELLQILLHKRSQDSHFKNSTINLTVALTCWDEFESTVTPKEELNNILPLLLNFIESNWIESKIKILGLSSLGFSLKEEANKKKYQDNGSENYGYMINSMGVKNNDITQLVLDVI